jgi:ubiquinone/menaquinone biosynthesis C-methylase UbiE
MLSIASTPMAENSSETAAELAAVANLCKAAADPLRLKVLRVLLGQSFGVSELCKIFDIRQPALSHHLKILANAALVATRRDGNSIFYQRSELGQIGELGALKGQIFDSIDRTCLPEDIRSRVSEQCRQRGESSLSFFALNSHKFKQQQDLIASYKQYAVTVAEMLRKVPLKQRRVALEVGPGDGSFLAELSPRFERVIALDNAAEMLAKARSSAASAGFGNVTFIHGDTASSELKEFLADCVVINMVMHHSPSPAQIFADVAACLAPDGVLLVTDLCRHDQDWARESCGDLWLGFEPQDLANWAADAGLQDIASVYLAQRNGFQIQVRLFAHC